MDRRAWAVVLLSGVLGCSGGAEQSDAGSDAGADDASDGTTGPQDAGSEGGATDAADADVPPTCAIPSAGSGIQVTGVTPLGANQVPFTPRSFDRAASTSTTTVRVFFLESVDPATAGDPANYTITPSLAVSAATVSSPASGPWYVDLTTAAQTPSTSYSVSASGVKNAATTATFPTTSLAFEGYHFHANAYGTGPNGGGPLTVVVRFTEPADCATATDPANYAIPSYVVTSATSGYCTAGSTTTVAYLTLDHALAPGNYTLTISNVASSAGGLALSPATADFVGPTVPARLYVFSAFGSAANQVQVDFSDLVDPTSGALASNYALTPAVSLANGSVSNEQATLAGTTTADQVYSLDVSNVLVNGATVATKIPRSALWGYDSLYVDSALLYGSSSVILAFSEKVDTTTASNVANYAFSGGVTASKVQINAGFIAVISLAGATPGTTYTATVSPSVLSTTGVPMATVFGRWVDVALSAPAYTGTLPSLMLAGQDLSVDRAPFFSGDGKHLYVDTGLLAPGTYTLSICGLEDAPRTSTLSKDVTISIP